MYLVQEKHMTVYTYDRLTMVQKEEIPDLSQIIGIRAETESETVELEYLEENDLTYTDQYTWFLKNNGGYAPADQSVVEGLLLYLEDMSWLACADYAMTEPEVYGLDVPAARYTLTYLDGEEEKTFCLNVGDGDDEGIWVNIPGSSMVYTVNSTLGQMLGQMDADSYVCKDVILLDLEPVTAVELTVDAMSCTLEKTETEQEDGTVLTQWMLEDASVEIEATLLSMSELQGSSWEGTVEGLEPELTVTFRRNTENYPVLTVSFYRYSGSECIAVCNDGAPLSVYRTDVVTLKEAILAAVLPG